MDFGIEDEQEARRDGNHDRKGAATKFDEEPRVIEQLSYVGNSAGTRRLELDQVSFAGLRINQLTATRNLQARAFEDKRRQSRGKGTHTVLFGKQENGRRQVEDASVKMDMPESLGQIPQPHGQLTRQTRAYAETGKRQKWTRRGNVTESNGKCIHTPSNENMIRVNEDGVDLFIMVIVYVNINHFVYCMNMHMCYHGGVKY